MCRVIVEPLDVFHPFLLEQKANFIEIRLGDVPASALRLCTIRHRFYRWKLRRGVNPAC